MRLATTNSSRKGRRNIITRRCAVQPASRTALQHPSHPWPAHCHCSIAKLPGVGSELVETASACARAGAHGITLIDGVPGMSVDAERLASALGPVVGGLTGPAIRPIALRAVFEVTRALPGVPVMGVGGVRTGTDAVELLLAGAGAVQIGTAMLVDPSTPASVVDGIAGYLESKGLRSAADIQGRLRSSAAVPRS